MKKIIATDIEYGPLGDRKKATLHYEDGTTKTINLPIDRKDQDSVRDGLELTIDRLNKLFDDQSKST